MTLASHPAHHRSVMTPKRRLAVSLGLLLAAAATSGAAASMLPAPSAKAAEAITVYVGTYSEAGSRGIYRFSFDAATGTAGEPVLAVESENPSFLALHPSGRFLYAVNELESFEGEKAGAVSAYRIEPSGALVFLNRRSSKGSDPCHLSVDRAGRHLLVANYGSGNVALLAIGADGALAAASVVVTHDGSGPNHERQATPHAHGIYLDPAERFALSPDLGADRVFVARFDAARGALLAHGEAALAPGSGPRHLAFDPGGRRVYVINELSSTLTALRYEPATGALATIGSVSTLPGDADKSGNSTAEVAVSPDGRFVYGSNRGHDSLAVFRVEKDGRLTAVGDVPVGGKTPRHFALDPSGRWLLAAHQESGTIAVFRVDAGSGLPQATGVRIAVPRPVCLLFAR